MCWFRYYSEEPTDTALRPPGSQHHQREDPAVSLLLFTLAQQGNLGWESTVCCYTWLYSRFFQLINFVFSSFFLCYEMISKRQAGKAAFLRQKATVIGGVVYKVKRSLQKILMNVPVLGKSKSNKDFSGTKSLMMCLGAELHASSRCHWVWRTWEVEIVPGQTFACFEGEAACQLQKGLIFTGFMCSFSF